jgi:hypothetical protein
VCTNANEFNENIQQHAVPGEPTEAKRIGTIATAECGLNFEPTLLSHGAYQYTRIYRYLLKEREAIKQRQIPREGKRSDDM